MTLLAGQRVTINGRTGNVLLDNTANVAANTSPGVFVAFQDQTYQEVAQNSCVNVAGGWLSGIGPGN